MKSHLKSAMKFLLKYYLDLMGYNLMVSGLGAWFGNSLALGFTCSFLISYATVGFAGSVGLYRYFRENEYYLFLNNGFSKSALISVAGAANLAVSVVSGLVLGKWGWL